MAERFLNNENHGRLRDAIDKGIVPVDHPQRAHNDLPPPIRGDAPMTMTLDPHGARLSVPPQRVERTTASDSRGAVGGDTSTRPTPLATGRIGPNARAELGKLGPEQRARMNEYLRK